MDRVEVNGEADEGDGETKRACDTRTLLIIAFTVNHRVAAFAS